MKGAGYFSFVIVNVVCFWTFVCAARCWSARRYNSDIPGSWTISVEAQNFHILIHTFRELNSNFEAFYFFIRWNLGYSSETCWVSESHKPLESNYTCMLYMYVIHVWNVLSYQQYMQYQILLFVSDLNTTILRSIFLQFFSIRQCYKFKPKYIKKI